MNETLVTTDDPETTRPDRESAREPERTTCPECDGQVVYGEERGERTCEDCGLVLDDDEIDRGPEWRTFEGDDADDRRRIGAPTTELMHDKGLSTTIGWRNRDANGNGISARKRERLGRLRTWDERYRAKDAQERNLKQAFGEIQRMASALGLPEHCQETAGALYRRAVTEGLLPGRSIEAMATASLYAAARRQQTPRTLVAFESVSRVEKLPVQRAYRYLTGELDLAIAPTDPTQYVPRHASDLGISDEAERLATDILESTKPTGVHSGKSPAGLAAAALYAASRLTNERLTQATVSEATDVCTVTIRDRYQELLDAYGDRGEQ